MKRKNITIEQRHETFIEKEALNLSKLVRKMLDNMMKGDAK